MKTQLRQMNSAAPAHPSTLYCTRCGQTMRIRMAAPAEGVRGTRMNDCGCGQSENINVAVRRPRVDRAAALQTPLNNIAQAPIRLPKRFQNRPIEMVAASLSQPKAAPVGTITSQQQQTASVQSSVGEAMLSAVPTLRAFAMSLCRNVDAADDLVQETLLRAWAHIDSFRPGTNMSAWLFTILRNHFRSDYRKRRHEVRDVSGSYVETLKSPPEQQGRVELEEFRVALAKLPPDQRDALLLIGASGFSYVDAAVICRVAVGTIKSRVNRARTGLSKLLAMDSADDLGPDQATRAVLTAGGRC